MHGPEVLKWRVQLNIMSWAQNQTAIFPNRLEPFNNFSFDIGRCPEWQRMLFVNGSPKAELVPELHVSAVQDPLTSGLNRVQDIYADFN